MRWYNGCDGVRMGLSELEQIAIIAAPAAARTALMRRAAIHDEIFWRFE